MGDVIDFAGHRVDSLAKTVGLSRGQIRVCPANTGDCLVEWVWNGEVRRQVLLTIDEARDLRDRLSKAIFDAGHIAHRVHGLVLLAWCDTKGEPVTQNYVRGRIVRRVQIVDAACVEVVIEPEEWQREPRRGWPKAGLYGLDGWPMARDPRRRGWRVISGMPARETTHG